MKRLVLSLLSEQQTKDLKHFLTYLPLLNFWSGAPARHFVVVSQSRCGGGLLGTLLRQHAEVCMEDEIFNVRAYRKLKSLRLYLKAKCKRAASAGKTVYGFKLKYHHLIEQGMSEAQAKAFILELYEKGWKVIYLRRNNNLRRALSGIVGRERQLRHAKDHAGQTLAKVRIDGQTLLQSIENAERTKAIDEAILKEIPHLLVEYEKDLLDSATHQATCSRIFDYLGVPDVRIQLSPLQKTSADDLSGTIENYAELETFFQGTRYAQALKSHFG